MNSEERLNYNAFDTDGKMPKHHAPYNSPIYKLLLQIERKTWENQDS